MDLIAHAKTHFKAGRFSDAAACCREALKSGQAVVDSLMLLGSIGTLTNAAHASIPLLQLAASLAPKDISVLNALGLAHQAVQNHEQACRYFEQVLTLSPGRPETIRNLAHAQVARKDWKKAKALFSQLHSKGSFAQKDWLPYALSLHHLKEHHQAIALLREFLNIEPHNADAWHVLGMCLYDAKGASAAIPAYKTAIQKDKKKFSAYLNLTAVFNKHSNPGAAARTARELLRTEPKYFAIHVNYGLALASLGKSHEAVASFKAVIDSDPGNHPCHSNYVFYSQYLDDISPKALYERHLAWSMRHAEPLRRSWPKHRNTPDPNRRLRIGYVSPDLKGHSCAWFMLDLLAQHDHAAVEVFVYANLEQEDGVTALLKRNVDVWHNVSTLSETACARQIHEDRVDILIDLAGHTARNSLLTFACKPAPVQVTWLGYPGTTGLSAIDYRLSDPWLTPEGTPELFSEQIYNLPRVSHCFHPPAAPEPSPLPALRNGHITFGSFNTFAKISDTAARLWSSALAQVPTARLLLKSRYISSDEAREAVLDRFRRAGADLSRIDLVNGNERQHDHLQQYGQVDIALDSFPYGGMTTTCEALWMGVPVITMAGERTSARYGTSVLNAVGMGDLVATTPDEFGAIAARLAGDFDRLAHLRANLRARMANSPLCDGAGFARALEAAYRDMWTRWCQQQAKDNG
ncbi:tetratricopeptide repeat protein [Azospirillum picis]|uniref:protein O-GlcNAc transferase n=1 Tax=Azospirillum picis TaxID=488438 RepID=A0ABU0MU11_9PROT|nr:tetratricopeptide repeat protein [Azospirillum picis]MBP2303077.1 putative O-linked N-acetylglucosamine transferase (SPINDLY family) [Azospirillum picis]MDQ0536809.1 putative O-linked N-acetylglucosamine transferase (SPINDLY family) [Azospirillum picis]